MGQYCSLCAKPMEGEGNICEACQERIRSEAMGNKRTSVKEVHKELEKVSMRKGRGGAARGTKELTPHQGGGEEEEKRPHHFKSMAEYLDYLKGRR